MWPFSQKSPWNHPIGSAAMYSGVNGLAALNFGINYDDKWTCAIYLASTSDPFVDVLINMAWPDTNWEFLNNGGKNCSNTADDENHLRRLARTTNVYPANPWSTLSTPDDSRWILPSDYHRSTIDYRPKVYLPRGACASPDTDGLMATFQPDGWVLDTYATVVLADGDIVSDQTASFIYAKGDGTGWWNGRRASMLPSFAGLIRKGEMNRGRIPHALAVQMSPTLLKEQALWPAYAFDRNSGYAGTLPMGALLAIPANVNIDSLRLSPKGRIIAKAAQDYGIYVVDRGGPGGMTLLAELGNREIRWTEDRKDLDIIGNNLKWITNNSKTSIGGGGTPRAPWAPPFSAQ